MSPFDTIVAPITGLQPAAVAVVRLSGSDAWEVAAKVFSNWPEKVEPMNAVYGRYVTGDDGIVLPFAEGHSYTGEQAVELSCHGSPASIRALVEACIAAGARPARAGEFTERAFLNGRIDLTQAEAVADTINAQTDAQLRMATRQREGLLCREVTSLRNDVLSVLAAVEAAVDFEEEIGPFDRVKANQQLDLIATRLHNLLKTSDLGRILRRGLRVAIIGPPNAGKSSLFNAILGHERAIVTPVAGTTRDYIEEAVDIHGIPVVFVDTAGLRDTCEEVESIGIERARHQAETADMTWYVYDSTGAFPGGQATCIVANKADLLTAKDFEDMRFERHNLVSAKTGEGLDHLLLIFAEYAEEAATLNVPAPNERHSEQLRLALTCIQDSFGIIAADLPFDFLSTQLRGAANHLGEITGETASADMIERIFTDFCVGK